MATKTISLELDAYERLAAARNESREPFSSVVRRARWDKPAMTGAKILEYVQQMIRDGACPLTEANLDAMDSAQANPRISPSKWSE